jgi:hypothetical protein
VPTGSLFTKKNTVPAYAILQNNREIFVTAVSHFKRERERKKALTY